MRTPDEIAKSLRRRFEMDYPDWARGRGSWPLRINLCPPTPQERSGDPVACHAWTDRWRAASSPGTLEFANARFPTGVHRLPRRLILATPGQVAAANPETRATWQRCGARLTELERTFPRARFDRIIRKITDLPEQDYQRLVSTTQWVINHPTSGMLLRQLPIEGIGTKWLGRHAALLLALLGDSTTVDDDEDIGADTTGSQRIQLHRRLGLRVPPDLIQVAVLDPLLRAQVAGMRHFAAGVDDLNAWPRTPDTVVILENKETGYAITDDNPGTVVLHGLGFSVAHYARIDWVRAASKVIYWGDIDLPGLSFVNDLRGLGVNATTILMDIDTLDRFRHLAEKGAASGRQDLPRLTPGERELYERLLGHVASHGTGLLLEQERISWEYAHAVLTAAWAP